MPSRDTSAPGSLSSMAGRRCRQRTRREEKSAPPLLAPPLAQSSFSHSHDSNHTCHVVTPTCQVVIPLTRPDVAQRQSVRAVVSPLLHSCCSFRRLSKRWSRLHASTENIHCLAATWKATADRFRLPGSVDERALPSTMPTHAGQALMNGTHHAVFVEVTQAECLRGDSTAHAIAARRRTCVDSVPRHEPPVAAYATRADRMVAAGLSDNEIGRYERMSRCERRGLPIAAHVAAGVARGNEPAAPPAHRCCHDLHQQKPSIMFELPVREHIANQKTSTKRQQNADS